MKLPYRFAYRQIRQSILLQADGEEATVAVLPVTEMAFRRPDLSPIVLPRDHARLLMVVMTLSMLISNGMRNKRTNFQKPPAKNVH